MSGQTYPPYADYRGQRLLLLEVKEQPEIAGHPTRLGYGYASQGKYPDVIVYYRWDFGHGVDWELTWANPTKEMSIDALEQALVKKYPEQMEMRPTEKLMHELPKRPRKPRTTKPKKRLQETPPEAKGERVKLDLSAFIRPFQASMTEGNKKK